jgi:purine-binding chemotaxis protein CheW
MSTPTSADRPPVAGAPGEEGNTSSTRQYVTFMAGDEVFAVEMAPVQEIIRVPEVVRVPMAPHTLEGLANLRGHVLPIVSLRRALGFDERVSDDSSRAVVINFGEPLGFVVDKVSSVVGVDPSKIEGLDGVGCTVDADLLSGIIKDVGGHAMVMVLNFQKLIDQEFAHIARMQRDQQAAGITSLGSGSVASQEGASEDELHLVSFDVAAQEYAIAISDVQEIVQIPDTIIKVPRSQSHVLGVMTLRNRLLPLVSLRSMFGLDRRASDEASRIVVVSVQGASVGVVVDNVNEVLRVPQKLVEPMPPLLAREGDMADITEICSIDGGKRLVSIISTDNLFRHSAIKDALANLDADSQRVTDRHLNTGLDDEQVVVFRLGTEEFGVPIESVQEIVRVPSELTHVPKAPPAVEGVINLRGQVLPVMDLRRRLGLGNVARNDGQRIVVFMIHNVRTGFIVDSVAEVLKVPQSAIEPAPRMSEAQTSLLARMANLEKQKRMLQLLEPSHLLADTDMHQMAAISA